MAPDDLAFRCLPADGAEARTELARLVFDVFDLDLGPLDRFGHDPGGVSFGWWRGETLVAHVGLFRQVLWLAGERVEGIGVQSVAVRPEWRGRGLFRDLMERALAHADARVGLVTLATETPELYERFGFRPLEEASFAGPLEPGGARANRRRLSLDADGDVALVRDLFARRTPVSLVCGSCDHPSMFFLKALENPDIVLEHLPDLDAVVAIETCEPGRLCLLDVVAPVIPPLAAIAAALGGEARQARVWFAPDRLGWRPATIVPEDEGTMVRGRFAAEGQPFMLPTMRV